MTHKPTDFIQSSGMSILHRRGVSSRLDTLLVELRKLGCDVIVLLHDEITVEAPEHVEAQVRALLALHMREAL